MAKTKVLISFAVTAKLICVFVFAYAKSRFSHNTAHIPYMQKTAIMTMVIGLGRQPISLVSFTIMAGSKAIILGQQPFYVYLARATAQVGSLVLPGEETSVTAQIWSYCKEMPTKGVARITVYRRKGSYRFKTAFPEPYPPQKRNLFAKNKTWGKDGL